jgi:DinB superfamily
MNPYASQLGPRDPVVTIGETAERLRALIQKIGAQKAGRPIAPGKWSPHQIACHLADCELAFSFRLRQALAQDGHVMQPFDQDKWAANYAAYDTAAALAVFSAVRSWNVALLLALPAEAFARKVSHPERGEMTFQTIVETMGGHDLNHLEQLETAAG